MTGKRHTTKISSKAGCEISIDSPLSFPLTSGKSEITKNALRTITTRSLYEEDYIMGHFFVYFVRIDRFVLFFYDEILIFFVKP